MYLTSETKLSNLVIYSLTWSAVSGWSGTLSNSDNLWPILVIVPHTVSLLFHKLKKAE